MARYPTYFNDDHDLLRASVRRFVEHEILPFVDQWEETGSFPRELYSKAGAAGFLGIGFDPQYGGSGDDVFMAVTFAEEITRCTSGGLVASLGSLGIALPPIARWGSEAIRQRVMPAVIAGEKIAALAVTEPGGGSDVASIRTRAEKTANHYRVNGSKTFITSGIRADYYVVAVRTGEPGHAGISLLLLEKGMPGFTTGRNLKKMGWWASDTAELFFEDCMVPLDNLIGPENSGFYCAMDNFQMERLNLAVIATTTAQVALEQSLAYVQQREAFGRKLQKFQVLRHKLAEMATRIEVSREFKYRENKTHLSRQSFRGNGRLTAEQTEIRRLREENRRLKMEKDILKKATVGLPPTSLPRKRGEVRVHHPAQEDLAGRRNVSTTGCESP